MWKSLMSTPETSDSKEPKDDLRPGSTNQRQSTPHGQEVKG